MESNWVNLFYAPVTGHNAKLALIELGVVEGDTVGHGILDTHGVA